MGWGPPQSLQPAPRADWPVRVNTKQGLFGVWDVGQGLQPKRRHGRLSSEYTRVTQCPKIFWGKTALGPVCGDGCHEQRALLQNGRQDKSGRHAGVIHPRARHIADGPGEGQRPQGEWKDGRHSLGRNSPGVGWCSSRRGVRRTDGLAVEAPERSAAPPTLTCL